MVTDLLLRVALAGLLGGLIGLERQLRAKEAGLRTHILVGIGSALFMIVSKYGFTDILTLSHVELDPSRIAAQVVSGMGFLGAGTIIIQKQAVKGLTTAAGMWVTAAIGLVIGSGLYEIGIYGTLMTLTVLELFRQLSNLLLGEHRSLIIHLPPEKVSALLLTLQQLNLKPERPSLRQQQDEALCEIRLEVTLRPRQRVGELYQQLQKIDAVRFLEIR
ncbi:MgtC/SapB family protein [Edwardsiella ictaluri]|uniref:Protein MgtC n=1 Tax=Edwardsiella ictaluri (strain 93-146) TaxID=634503 RepID=C5B9Y8_EDWI9|nr:MgtC/SapB family protein [Edwardsiella ictaluri]ACR69109.1 putative Mg2+ transporter-C (MgtC) family [Edwardsiella ictaluri 93-146]ARD38455.1 methyltransferase [Edwardsiella ictaluri]AVZ83802.1 MgtC/SapB family protein [Edwardsiella ictaluri]EKS7763592.1 MgtC/SapB family protein [Edwardsiella ictaluri]EKS7764912.1 MgtC/SapB family protein [Edwardsiella ictaluri]